MKLWFDTENNCPKNYIWCSTLFILKSYILGNWNNIVEVNLCPGNKGLSVIENDVIRFLKWLEDTTKQGNQWQKISWKFNFHNMSLEQKAEAETIITKNNWKIIEED